MNNSEVPISIKLIFENKKLTIMNFLVTAYILTLRRKKINIYECIFYYILGLIEISDNDNVRLNKKEFQYNYFKIDKSLKLIMIYLSNRGYIYLDSDKCKKFSDINIRLTDMGKKVVSELEGEYYIKLKEKLKYNASAIKYKKSYYKQLVGDICERDLY